MPIANLKPNERYAMIGKTRSGKTRLAIVIAATFAMTLYAPWEVWWIDTKDDPADLRELRKWGFRNAESKKDRTERGGLKNALYFLVRDQVDKNGITISVVEQAQAIFRLAYQRRNVIVVVDEYTSVTVSSRTAGEDLLNLFTRGGGRNCGIIGLTQEPVDVPRQLLSQATHLVLLSLSYEYDKDYVKKYNKQYVSPNELGDNWGFYWAWIDGTGEWVYWHNQAEWYNELNIAVPRAMLPVPIDT